MFDSKFAFDYGFLLTRMLSDAAKRNIHVGIDSETGVLFVNASDDTPLTEVEFAICQGFAMSIAALLLAMGLDTFSQLSEMVDGADREVDMILSRLN